MNKELRTSKQSLIGLLIRANTHFKGHSCRCPFHDDQHASGGVYEKEGIWRYKCHGCGLNGDYFDIKSLVDKIPLAELLKDRPALPPKVPPTVYADLDRVAAGMDGQVNQYHYTHPTTSDVDMVTFRISSSTGKVFRTFRPVEGGYVMQAPPKPWPIYNRTRIVDSGTVIVVEGEKCVHILNSIDIVATTSPCGAGKAQYADWSPLLNKTVYLWPDNDDNGIKHMQEVRDLLLKLDDELDVTLIDVDPLDLTHKGDVEQYLAEMGGASKPEMKLDIEQLCKDARVVDPASELYRHICDIGDGKLRDIAWPWPEITRMSRALIPGTITVLAGPPCSSKSLLALESLTYWTGQGIQCSYLALEEDRKFHARRIWVQMAEDSRLLDNEFVEKNAEHCLEVFTEHASEVEEVARRIFVPDVPNVSLVWVSDWCKARAKKGDRIMIIDPVTIADGNSDQCWVDDKHFMSAAGKLAAKYGLSIILVTHPRKGRKGAMGLDEIAGGAAYQRFSQCVLWLDDHRPSIPVHVTSPVGGEMSVKVNRTIKIFKARNSRYNMETIGYNLCGESLRFSEQGVIKKDQH